VSQVFVVSASTATADLLRPAGLAVTPTHVLWSNSDVPKVGRAALTGPVDQITIFLDGQEVVNTPGSAAVVSATRYYSGSGLLATRSMVGGLTFVGTDSQGTLTATLTTAGVSARQRYKPFGEQRGTPLNALPSERGFVGQVEDTAAGLSYLNARHYDAKNATFISVDPVLLLEDPVSLNAYLYAENSPVVMSDPSGMYAAIDDGVSIRWPDRPKPTGPCSLGDARTSCNPSPKGPTSTGCVGGGSVAKSCDTSPKPSGTPGCPGGSQLAGSCSGTPKGPSSTGCGPGLASCPVGKPAKHPCGLNDNVTAICNPGGTKGPTIVTAQPGRDDQGKFTNGNSGMGKDSEEQGLKDGAHP
jgi:RHS repeat-associated protein